MKAEEYLEDKLCLAMIRKNNELTLSWSEVEEYKQLVAFEAVEEYKKSLISQDVEELIEENTVCYTMGEVINSNSRLLYKGDVKGIIQIIEAKHQKQMKGMISVEKAVDVFWSAILLDENTKEECKMFFLKKLNII